MEVAMRIPILTSAFAASILIGCSSPMQSQASIDRDADQMIQTYGPQCSKRGYTQDSHQWRNCVYQLGKTELSDTDSSEENPALIHRLGQRLGLIRGGGFAG